MQCPRVVKKPFTGYWQVVCYLTAVPLSSPSPSLSPTHLLVYEKGFDGCTLPDVPCAALDIVKFPEVALNNFAEMNSNFVNGS